MDDDRQRRISVNALGLALLLIVGLFSLRPWLTAKQRQANEALAVADLLEFGEEVRSFAYGMNEGGFVSPETLVHPDRNNPRIQFLHPRFLFQVRNGYRFEFRGVVSRRSRPIHPAFGSFVYEAAPIQLGITGGRKFALVSDTMAVHVRSDGETPTPDDPVEKRLR